jgi:hypothetical protein
MRQKKHSISVISFTQITTVRKKNETTLETLTINV